MNCSVCRPWWRPDQGHRAEIWRRSEVESTFHSCPYFPVWLNWSVNNCIMPSLLHLAADGGSKHLAAAIHITENIITGPTSINLYHQLIDFPYLNMISLSDMLSPMSHLHRLFYPSHCCAVIQCSIHFTDDSLKYSDYCPRLTAFEKRFLLPLSSAIHRAWKKWSRVGAIILTSKRINTINYSWKQSLESNTASSIRDSHIS